VYLNRNGWYISYASFGRDSVKYNVHLLPPPPLLLNKPFIFSETEAMIKILHPVFVPPMDCVATYPRAGMKETNKCNRRARNKYKCKPQESGKMRKRREGTRERGDQSLCSRG
jgi:hypothetical protein